MFLVMTKYFKEWWWSESQNCHLSQDHNGTSILRVQETRWGHWRDLITVSLRMDCSGGKAVLRREASPTP